MSVWLEMAAQAEIGELNSSSLPDTQTKPDNTQSHQPGIAFSRVLSGCRVEGGNKTPTSAEPFEKLESTAAIPSDDPYQHGKSISGNPRTWTGKVVSLNAWRDLSEWERHGSTGKVWNGQTRQWEAKLTNGPI